MKTLKQVEMIGAKYGDPPFVCYFGHDEHEDWFYAYFCRPCAENVLNWLGGKGEKPGGVHTCTPDPDEWSDALEKACKCEPDDLFCRFNLKSEYALDCQSKAYVIERNDGYESHGFNHCEACGELLDGYPTGIADELQAWEAFIVDAQFSMDKIAWQELGILIHAYGRPYKPDAMEIENAKRLNAICEAVLKRVAG